MCTHTYTDVRFYTFDTCEKALLMEEATHMVKLRASDWEPDLDNVKTGL